MTARAIALFLAAVLVACTGPQARQYDSLSPLPAPSQLDIPVQFASRYAAAQTATTLFHVRFDQRNFSRIYAMADESFRATTNEADLTARLTALRDRVDIVDRSPDVLITLVMETTFDNATLTETFVWRVTPSEMIFLVRYESRGP